MQFGAVANIKWPKIASDCNVNQSALYNSVADYYIKCIQISVDTLYLPVLFLRYLNA